MKSLQLSERPEFIKLLRRISLQLSAKFNKRPPRLKAPGQKNPKTSLYGGTPYREAREKKNIRFVEKNWLTDWFYLAWALLSFGGVLFYNTPADL